MYLRALQTATPPRAFTQQECWDRFTRTPLSTRLKPRSVGIARKVLLGDNGIDQRHFALTALEELFDLDAESLHAGFAEHAPRLAGQALQKALVEAGIEPTELDGLVICTCTGYLCPGISSYVAEQLGLRDDAVLFDLVGLGCGAAIPALRAGSNLLAAEPEGNVAVVAVEVCSAAFYMDDDPGVVISACLFGDGAAATIWSGQPPAQGPVWHAGQFASHHDPAHREHLRFENRGGKLRNRLDLRVPTVAGEAVRNLYERSAGEGDAIVLHPGGRDIIDAMAARLPLSPPCEHAAREVLRLHGNMSSPSVLFVLAALREQGGEFPFSSWLCSFGAGFTAHACRLERVD